MRSSSTRQAPREAAWTARSSVRGATRTMRRLMWLLLLSACSRDIAVSTVLDDTGGLRPGDKVYLASREVGSVDSVEATKQAPGFTVEFSLYPEHAELIQTNALAYVPLKSPPMLVLLNPTEPAAPVAAGTRLKGLSPFGAAIWQASDAAAAVSDFMEQFAQEVDSYFRSEDWARTRAQIDQEIAELTADSKAAAERIMEEFQRLIELLSQQTAGGAHAARQQVTAIEADIDRLEAQGHGEFATSLRRLLEQIKAMAPSEKSQPAGNETPDTH